MVKLTSPTKKRLVSRSEDSKRNGDQNPGALSVLSKTEVTELANQVEQSPKYYNNLSILLKQLSLVTKKLKAGENVSSGDELDDKLVFLISKLFRCFGKLIKKGVLIAAHSTLSVAEADATNSSPASAVSVWLRQRYNDFVSRLLKLVKSAVCKDDKETSIATSIAALSVLMRLVQQESSHFAPNAGEPYFASSLFRSIIESVLLSDLEHGKDESGAIIDHFIDQYFSSYDDIRYYFFVEGAEVAKSAKETYTPTEQRRLFNSFFSVLSTMKALSVADEAKDEKDRSESPRETFWVNNPPMKASKEGSRKTAVQKLWLAVLKLSLTNNEYKSVLFILHKRIIPFFANPQLLMDFLTECYDSGEGVIPILALNGLFELIRKHNLDFPKFYDKLYSLFNEDLLHVVYRSRFFRLTDLFLSSTHLPAALVGSFIKRMSRLALTAPPAGIAIVVPFIYNLLKRHPTCMILIHRPGFTEPGFQDPFDNEETDPLKTSALDSSLWEMETLTAHYQPNVATLAKIFGEPFRKPKYNLEDFLDLSYSTMLDAERAKKLKDTRLPALEYEQWDKTFPENKEECGLVHLEGWAL